MGEYDSFQVTESGFANSDGESGLCCSVDDGTLVVKAVKDSNGINVSGLTKLKIYCPDENYKSIVLSCGSGSVQVENLMADSLEAENNSGEMEITGRFSQLTVNNGSGTMDIVCITMPDMVNLKGGSGGITLALPEDGDFLLKLNKGSGIFKSDFSLLTTEDGNYLYGKGTCQITAETGPGRLNLTQTLTKESE